MSYIRVFSDEEGETHFEDVKIELESVDRDYSESQIKLSSIDPAVEYAFFGFPSGLDTDWHPASQKVMLFILSGEMELRVSDGESRRLHGGSVVLTEDVKGKGHKGKVLGSSDVFGVSLRLSE